MNILQDIKLGVGVSVESDEFDTEILLITNSVVSTLTQLGVTEATGLVVREDTEWPTFASSIIEAMTKTYIYLSVKKVFDPTASATIESSLGYYLRELEYRLLVETEGVV